MITQSVGKDVIQMAQLIVYPMGLVVLLVIILVKLAFPTDSYRSGFRLYNFGSFVIYILFARAMKKQNRFCMLENKIAIFLSRVSYVDPIPSIQLAKEVKYR